MTVRYLVTGASGLLGKYLIPCIQKDGYDVIAVTNTHNLSPGIESVVTARCDITQRGDLELMLDQMSPDVIIHAAGMTSVDQCEVDHAQARLMNTNVPSWVAQWAAKKGRKYVFISSDHVTGGGQAFFCEEDIIDPVNMYARTKADAEILVSTHAPSAQIIRTNFFGRGPVWRKSLTDWLWERAFSGEGFPAFTDSFFSPISAPLLSKAIVSLSQLSASGIFHVGGRMRVSKYDFAINFFEYYGLDKALVLPAFVKDAHLVAARPIDMSMSVRKIEDVLGYNMPDLLQSFKSIENDYQSLRK